MQKQFEEFGITEKDYKNSKRGFASMNPEKQKRIASMGGKEAHRSGKAHKWTSEEARIAGKKGGNAIHFWKRGDKPKSKLIVSETI